MNFVFWDVFVGNKCVDSVPYDSDCDAEYVRTTLVEHDRYPPQIKVRRVERTKKR